MFHSLYAKLAAALAVLFITIGCLFVLVLGLSAGMYRQEINQQLGRDLAENILAEYGPFQNERLDQETLEQLFHTFMVVNPSIEVYLLDPTGRILSFYAPSEKVQLERVSLGPIERFLQGRDMMPIVGDDPRHPGQRKAFSVAPVREHGQTRGYLYVILGGERHDDIAHTLRESYIVPLSGFLLGAAVLFTLAAGLLLFYFLTRRLRTLAANMESFKQSGFSSPVPTQEPSGAHDDELDRLTQTFSEMAARIVEQMDQLKRTDALRREMVANVSHDLRTPLASLQGYLETLLLKEQDLSAEQRRHYLAVAAKHGERLSKLVAELFELAKLDTEDAKPHCEPFSLAELVQDVTQKFRLRAEKKGITLESRYTPDLPFVKADIALIERVLENLIENALRYTPSGGTIRIGLKPEADSVTVVVSDTGHGIPKQDLPHIFDRFYRVEKARGSCLSAGLGLAIAKRIVELHGEAIQVKSALNKGATFLFHLPVYARSH